MSFAERAPVKPRVFVSQDGEILPLEDVIGRLVAANSRGVVYLLGSAGSGKTTALRHLAAVLPEDAALLLLDEGETIHAGKSKTDCLVVRAVTGHIEPRVRMFRLAPWSDDDLIEYMLVVHKDHCASVMSRLSIADRDLLRGTPELWRIVLDEMVRDPLIVSARAALRRYLHMQLADPKLLDRARYACLGALMRDGGQDAPPEKAGKGDFKAALKQKLRHVEVQLLLAAERVVEDLRSHADCDYLPRRLPRPLIKAVAAEAAGDTKIVCRLHDLLEDLPTRHAMAASLLYALDPGWVPRSIPPPVLAGAYLDRAAWAGVQLPLANLREANIGHADLSGSNLDGADLYRANLCQARLTGASMNELNAVEADLIDADLSGAIAEKSRWNGANLKGARLVEALLMEASFHSAKLSGANLVRAYLSQATFAGAELSETDFSGADLNGAYLAKLDLRSTVLSGAFLSGANLSGSNLEGLELAGVDAQNVNLERALLTETVLTDANLRGACLREAGLGDVNLERACLRETDLRGATFHMGSSRSGKLYTPIASEGTRTGFYTDDADDQHFKAPEEIRKANLRGADLRGANIEGVDFYLVDLRDAVYDAEQEQHFRHCRAILKGRA